MNIISASRRTDIPHYYARWFRERRKAGFAEYRTVFGGGRNGRFSVSLKPEDVLAYLFWTKYAGPFQEELAELRAAGVPYAFQYTLTGYGPGYEPDIPAAEDTIRDFLSTAAHLPAADCIQWRYDPIVLSSACPPDWHRRNFERIADALCGSTRVVNVSFVEPYLKAISKAPAGESIRWRRPDPGRHKAVFKKYPHLPSAGAEAELLLQDLSDLARSRGMELRICCNEEWSGRFPGASCCGLDLFLPFGKEMSGSVSRLAAGPSRTGCGCRKVVDIGMDTTCPGGCFYCYVTTTREQARMNYHRHDPAAAWLR